MRAGDDASEIDHAMAGLRDDGDDARAQWEKAGLRARLFGGPPPRRTIGRYEVIERLGAGGMGEVFAARDPLLERPVAIKLLHADLQQDTEEHRARMIREAKTLAKLSHPNVVQVYEVGEAEGRVFLAMELVRGMTLRRWQADERPGWREVLARYLEAGRGLVAVHRAGLVHRDFKPDNVLVGEDGRVCVADFGLARHATGLASVPSGSSSAREATLGADAEPSAGSDGEDGRGSGSAPPTRLTHTGRIAGTPAYMAPEQLRAEELDARVDQFGFCVALYEALYGRRPFEGRTVAALIDAHARGPAAPSRRSAVPRRLWRALARGLARDRDARFESLEALLRALDPARARRRRLLVAVAGLSVPALYGAITHEGAADPCPRPSAEALGWGDHARARVRAVIEGSGLAYADATSNAVVTRLDRLADALAEQRVQVCRATHVEHVQSAELLDQRMLCLARISDRARGLVDALGQAEPDALDRVVEVVEGLPRPDLCGAEQVAFGMRPPDTPDRAAAVARARERVAQARAWHDLGRDAAAKQRLDADEPEILALDHPPLTAELRLAQGLVMRGLGEPTRAAALMLEGVELAEGSRHDLAAAELWNELALLGHEDLSIEETKAWLPRARAAVQRIGAPPELATTVAHHEGRLALRSGQLDRAAEVLVRVLAQRRAQALPLEVARAAEDLVELWKLRDDPSRALALLAEVGTLYAEQLGARHPQNAKTEYHVATMLIAQGRWDEARTRLEAALALWTERFGPDHLHVALVHIAQHQVELEAGSLDAALHHAREALRIREARLPADHPDVAYAQMVLGVSLMVRGEPEAAARAYTAAWEGLRAASGDDDLMAVLARANLSEAELAAGRRDSARVHAEAALRGLEAQIPGHPSTALPIKVLGKLALAAGDTAEALARLGRARAVLEAARTVDPLEHGDVLLALSDAHAAAGEPEKAAALAREAADRYAAATGEAGRGGLRRALARSREPAPLDPPREERSQ